MRPGDPTRRVIAASLVLATTLTGCAAGAGAPTALPSAVPSAAPAPTSYRDLPGNAPSPIATPRPSAAASPSPTGVAGDQTGNPWTGPAGAWPGTTLFTYPKNERGDVIGVAPDGTVYTHGGVSSTDYHEAIRAFGPDGTPRPTWPLDGVPVVGFFRDAVLDATGGVVVAMVEARKPGVSQTSPRAGILTAIDPNGLVKPGWPVTRSPTLFEPPSEYGHSLVARPAGGVCFVEIIGTSTTKTPDSDLTCLESGGGPVTGWAYHAPNGLGALALGPDGTLYVEEFSVTPAGQVEARIVALDPAGRPRAGWHPVSVAAAVDTQLVVAPEGVVYVLVKVYESAPSLIAADANGEPDTAFNANAKTVLGPLGPEGYPMGVALAPDGALYLAINLVLPTSAPSQPGQIVAIGPDGKMRPGWPFSPGAFHFRVQPGPDGSVWVWMTGAKKAVSPRLAVLGANGAVQPRLAGARS